MQQRVRQTCFRFKTRHELSCQAASQGVSLQTGLQQLDDALVRLLLDRSFILCDTTWVSNITGTHDRDDHVLDWQTEALFLTTILLREGRMLRQRQLP